uniref:Cellulase n=1 Tax=uncultured bacterium contig00004 TaxID=1181496 RepID=A0A806JXW6_9BACT|nr:cellulase [uncultured bacterium contig00004]
MDPNNEAMLFAKSMKIGWNLGNTMDGHDRLMPGETVWVGQSVTQELINEVAAQGFNAVRIPVTWGRKLHEDLRYNPDDSRFTLTVDQIKELKIDEAWLNRVAEIVGYVKTAGMKAIINIHHDGADSRYWLSVKTQHLTGKNKELIDAVFITLWTQIAQKFIDEGDYLVFEAFNELHDGNWGDGNSAQHRRINDLNNIFVRTVRATGGQNLNRFLVIPGWVTRPSVTVRSLVLPKDSVKNRLIVTVHYYDPYDFTGSARSSKWGSKAIPGGNANESSVLSTFNSVRSKFIDKGIPVIIGEYGAVRQSSATGKAYRLYYMEYVTKAAIDRGIIPFYWDNGSNPNQTGGGEQFGLFNRASPYNLATDATDVVARIMKAVNENYSISKIKEP